MNSNPWALVDTEKRAAVRRLYVEFRWQDEQAGCKGVPLFLLS